MSENPQLGPFSSRAGTRFKNVPINKLLSADEQFQQWVNRFAQFPAPVNDQDIALKRIEEKCDAINPKHIREKGRIWSNIKILRSITHILEGCT